MTKIIILNAGKSYLTCYKISARKFGIIYPVFLLKDSNIISCENQLLLLFFVRKKLDFIVRLVKVSNFKRLPYC